jgi:hypothetical protein
MASSVPETSKWFAHDIAGFSDAELDEYLKANGNHVIVDDWENLMKDQDFIQRLR